MTPWQGMLIGWAIAAALIIAIPLGIQQLVFARRRREWNRKTLAILDALDAEWEAD